MQEESVPGEDRAELDLSLFRLPILPEHDTVEIPVSTRHRRSHTIKRNFWSQMARRVDLTGHNSPMKIRPYGTGHDRPLTNEVLVERLYDLLAERENANVLLDPSKARPLSVYRKVTGDLEEVQPQFFLRNIIRLERDIDVRRLGIQYAVWRDDPTEDFESIRRFELEPIDMIDEFSSEAITRLRIERQESTLGFVWDEVLTGYYPTPIKIHPFFWYPKRVPVKDLSLKPAPPYRYTPDGQTRSVMRQLAQRTDATKDDD